MLYSGETRYVVSFVLVKPSLALPMQCEIKLKYEVRSNIWLCATTTKTERLD
jgi:hypothetical protein